MEAEEGAAADFAIQLLRNATDLDLTAVSGALSPDDGVLLPLADKEVSRSHVGTGVLDDSVGAGSRE